MTRISLVCTLVVALFGLTAAFSPASPLVPTIATNDNVARLFAQQEGESQQELDSSPSEDPVAGSLRQASIALSTALPTSPLAAQAAGPDWGLFEGRTGSLIHPVIMGGLFLYTLYTAFLGFQWRRQRTMGDEISELKALLPREATAAGSVAQAVAAAEEAGDETLAKELRAAESTESAVKALQQERKDLAAAAPRDKHFKQGALLAFLGTAIAIEGCLNTYGRAGKLFPGPHLYAGAALVVLWGLAVATIPAMQKGDDTARTIHIGANVAGLAMFAWQVSTGIPILLKVVDLTSWP